MVKNCLIVCVAFRRNALHRSLTEDQLIGRAPDFYVAEKCVAGKCVAEKCVAEKGAHLLAHFCYLLDDDSQQGGAQAVLPLIDGEVTSLLRAGL